MPAAENQNGTSSEAPESQGKPAHAKQAEVEVSSSLDSGVQCNLQVMTDADTSDGASITAESVSSLSASQRLRQRNKSAPNHFRTQTAPPRLQKERKPRKNSANRQNAGQISDVTSETSSLDQAYHSHITCSVSYDAPGFYEYHRPISVYRRPLRRPLSLPSAFDDSEKLHHPELDPGQKEYLWHTASVYSVGNMKSLAQRRFRQALDHQVATGFHTREECDKYYRYLLSTRKRQYEADPSVWRAPPKLPVRPKQFRRRPRSQEEVEEARQVNTGYHRGQRSQGKGSKENLSASMEKLSLFYSTDLKRTLPRKQQAERS